MKLTFNTLLAVTLLAGGASAERTISTTITLGYDSHYVLYGYRQNHPLYHADISLSLPINEQLTLWGGSWGGSLSDRSYQEIDFYTGADLHLGGGVYAGLAYSYFRYLTAPWDAHDAHEISGHITWFTGPFSIGIHDLYDTEGEGHLARTVATYNHSFNDRIGLAFRAEYGYSFDYYAVGDGPNHALLRAELPIQITDPISLAPFIAQSLALDSIDDFENDQLYGGFNLQISF
jgi:hypothetical protein